METGSSVRLLLLLMAHMFIYKSQAITYFKRKHSLHKYRNFKKPLLCVASDGHILDIFGPYPTTSEADIMKALLQDEDSETQYFFTEGDGPRLS